jgi:hypothetical protein
VLSDLSDSDDYHDTSINDDNESNNDDNESSNDNNDTIDYSDQSINYDNGWSEIYYINAVGYLTVE